MSLFHTYRRALQAFQSNRLRRDYADLAAQPQYQAVGEFFFDEMYGPRDFSERNASARRFHQFLHIVPGVHLADVEQAIELLDLTDHLDEDLTRRMLDQSLPLDFDEPAYERIYRQADNYDQRLRQLHLVRDTLLNVYRLSQLPLLGLGLKQSRLLSRLAGFEGLHRFLMNGYAALHNVADVRGFADTIFDRELQRLDRIFEHS